jgi:hypothetical protein
VSFREKVVVVDVRLQELDARKASAKFPSERMGLLKLRGCFVDKVRRLIAEQRRTLQRLQPIPVSGVSLLVQQLTQHNIRALEALLVETAANRRAMTATTSVPSE